MNILKRKKVFVLSKSYYCALATRTPLSLVKLQLDNFGLLDCFVSIKSTELAHDKPDPTMFNEILFELGINPEDAIMIACHGWDVFGAKNAGLITGYSSHYEHYCSNYYPKAGKDIFIIYSNNTNDLFDDKKYSVLVNNEDIKIYIQGHTHHPEISYFDDGKIFINTGTWTNMYQLDFGRAKENEMLTYAKISVSSCKDGKTSLDASLLVWKGVNPNPFVEFS